MQLEVWSVLPRHRREARLRQTVFDADACLSLYNPVRAALCRYLPQFVVAVGRTTNVVLEARRATIAEWTAQGRVE